MTLIDFFKDVYDSSKNRLKSPFISSFLISWLIFNWKGILIVLFSTFEMKDRIYLVETGEYTDVWTCLLFPSIAAIIYVIILPYLFWILDYASTHSRNIRRAIRKTDRLNVLDIESAIVIKKEQLAKQRVKTLSEENEESKIQSLISEKESLLEEAITSREIADKLRLENTKLKKQVSEKDLYSEVDHARDSWNRYIEEWEVFSHSKLNKEFDFVVDVYEKEEFPSFNESFITDMSLREFYERGLILVRPDRGFTLTEKGTAFADFSLQKKRGNYPVKR